MIQKMMKASDRFHFENFDRVWFLTWTTYATWLPGDQRGFVSPKFDRPTTESRNNILETAYDANNHLHLLVGVMGDPAPSTLLRGFKSYAIRSLNREYEKPDNGTWWTE